MYISKDWVDPSKNSKTNVKGCVMINDQAHEIFVSN